MSISTKGVNEATHEPDCLTQSDVLFNVVNTHTSEPAIRLCINKKPQLKAKKIKIKLNILFLQVLNPQLTSQETLGRGLATNIYLLPTSKLQLLTHNYEITDIQHQKRKLNKTKGKQSWWTGILLDGAGGGEIQADRVSELLRFSPPHHLGSCSFNQVCPLARTAGPTGSVSQAWRWVWAEAGPVSPAQCQSVENRSPAEGSGARPPVTLGSSDRSGRLWMWDLSSFLTCVTLASFCLYSCRRDDSAALRTATCRVPPVLWCQHRSYEHWFHHKHLRVYVSALHQPCL